MFVIMISKHAIWQTTLDTSRCINYMVLHFNGHQNNNHSIKISITIVNDYYKSDYNINKIPSQWRYIIIYILVDLSVALYHWCVYSSLLDVYIISCKMDGPALTKVMACCLTAPSHYLNQSKLITGVLWNSTESNLTAITHEFTP